MGNVLRVSFVVLSFFSLLKTPHAYIEEGPHLSTNVWHKAYNFAYAPSQLGINEKTSRDFAAEFILQCNDNDKLHKSRYNKAYHFARRSNGNGLNLSQKKAKEWGRQFLISCADSNQLSGSLYRDAYDFAYSPNGMYFSHSRAQTFVEDFMLYCGDRDYLDIHKYYEVYNFAYHDTQGLDLGRYKGQWFAAQFIAHCQQVSVLSTATYQAAFNFLKLIKTDASQNEAQTFASQFLVRCAKTNKLKVARWKNAYRRFYGALHSNGLDFNKSDAQKYATKFIQYCN